MDQGRLSEFCFNRHDHKLLCFDLVRPSEIRFDQRDQNIYILTKFHQTRYVLTGATKTSRYRPSYTSEIRFDRRDQNIYVPTKFDQARYVSTGATKTSKFRPSSTKRDRFRPARPKTSIFRPNTTKRDTF